jgi:hypothetical protein
MPISFMLLEHLALRPGQLVSKAELLDAVWPDTHVTDSVLAGCVRELRRALDDDARAPRFVETAHRRGYRFIGAPVAPSTSPRVVPLTRTIELAALARRFALAVSRVGRRGRARPMRARGPRRRGQRGRAAKGRGRLR